MSAWTAHDIPDQGGRLAGEAAARDIAREVPGAAPEVRALDLGSLASVRRFAAELTADHPAIDLLVNNAGLVLLSDRQTTTDGFELHLGTNMLGHFTLTGLLLPAVERGDGPRVVTLSSIAHKKAHLDFDDLMAERSFRASPAYGASKLANTVFGYELDRRLRPVLSVLAHPGLSRTNLTPRAWTTRGRVLQALGRLFLSTTQPVEQGALPQLYAATGAEVRGGQFFGPDGFQERRGRLGEVHASAEATDPAVGRRLWAVAQELTGVSFL
ncbi:SDR family NAD(P)-dependent oxidoreductase [Promicromonospora citrea]|nr:SDR family NAD(P)-dependent oxidoreductase [Promicromonospora citrea]